MHGATRLLLEWYGRDARELPWRSTRDPYRIWLSEIMLQQTRVQTVIPYYHAFLERFPDVEALARASVQDVLSAWAGLGYYSRARNLHRAARQVAEQGGFPRDRKGLQALSGVGAYTAAAVGSIAFGLDAVAVDGNVRRVMARFHGITEDPRTPSGARSVETRARQLLPSGRAGTFNQALMDLGATLCTPRNPRCPACPWRNLCVAHRDGLEQVIPVRTRNRPPRPVTAVSAIWMREGAILLVRRPSQGLLGGLWGPPDTRCEPRESPDRAAERLMRQRLGVGAQARERLGRVEHVFTHLRWRAELVAVRGEDEPRAELFYPEVRFVEPAEIGALPLSRLAEKTLSVVQSPEARQLSLDL